MTKKEQVIHEQGLVSVLKEIHDDLDAAVFDAYGWPASANAAPSAMAASSPREGRGLR